VGEAELRVLLRMVLGRAGRTRRAEWLFEVVAVFRASGWHILLRDIPAGAGLRSKVMKDYGMVCCERYPSWRWLSRWVAYVRYS